MKFRNKGEDNMKYYMKQKVFSLRDKFTIKNEEGQDTYVVEGKLLSFGKKLYIFDMEGNELAYIEQQLMSFLGRFRIFVKGEKITEVLRKFSWPRPKYKITGKDWETVGSITRHEYVITDIATQSNIANIRKAWMAWGDTYELDIHKKEDDFLTILVVIAIDAAVATAR